MHLDEACSSRLLTENCASVSAVTPGSYFQQGLLAVCFRGEDMRIFVIDEMENKVQIMRPRSVRIENL